MNRKMRVIKEYTSCFEIRYLYEHGLGDKISLLYYIGSTRHQSLHSSFDDAVDYLYDVAIREGSSSE